jgi:S-adenosylmethionine:tRNA ribosyltransferase-isomerase
MKVDRFDFSLPEERIAHEPINPRDHAKLLEVASEQLHDKHIYDLPDLLSPNDLLIFNNTRVIPARLRGKRGEANVEVTLHKLLPNHHWRVFARPAKKLKLDDRFIISEGFSATVIEKHPEGECTLAFNLEGGAFDKALEAHGEMPLPPYIRKGRAEETDKQHYQTVFAEKSGAVAAPTAGLHFTEALLARFKEKNIPSAFVTLHVGAGTFLPVKVDDTKDHIMHTEYCELDAQTAKRINETKANGGRVIAVGTTALRTLESSPMEKGKVQPFSKDTGIFITPGYQFKVVDVLLTNFHLPRSTLFMLVCAFAGEKVMKDAYSHAIKNHYRFYSYGDGCLLHKGEGA